jgi:transcriptional regulator with XRE-family HTH domain
VSDSLSFATGRHIRIVMAARNMKQTDLSEVTGIASPIISLICNDRVSPTADQIQAIKEALAWPPNAEEAFAILIASGGDGQVMVGHAVGEKTL